MPTAIFSLYLNAEQVLDYYKGHKHLVRVKTESGQSMSVPYDIILKYVTHAGISGRFEISYSNEGKFLDLRKL